ncbi:MAG: carboxypeptidase regulatory-like domain-containing protein [Bacteroidetes bacterium]|nr:carboxypeptidase regulatory-like domain-containing protein [Bacteroidota bacterium]
MKSLYASGVLIIIFFVSLFSAGKVNQRRLLISYPDTPALSDTLFPPASLNVDPLTLISTWQAPVGMFMNKTRNSGDLETNEYVLLGYNVYLDDSLAGFTTDTLFQYDPAYIAWGQAYISAVSAVYDSGISDKIYYSWVSVYLPPPVNLQIPAMATIPQLRWDPPVYTYNKYGVNYGTIIAYNIYRFGNMIGSTYSDVFEYYDYDCVPGYNSYHVTAVYGQPTPGESMKEGPVVCETPLIVSFYGVVRQGGTLLPLAGVWVEADNYTTYTNDLGGYHIDLPSGIYNVSYEKPGYSGQGFPLVITGEVVINITLYEFLLPPQNLICNSMIGTIRWLPPLLLDTSVYFNCIEGGEIPLGWLQDYLQGSTGWEVYGGSPSGIPDAAYSGQYNLSFFGEPGTTKLITSGIHLGNAMLPRLHFWYTKLSGSASSELIMYYKRSPNGPWHHLETITDSVHEWTECVIDLPDPTDNYYIGFTGKITQYGNPGICIDDVGITSGYVPDNDNNERSFECYNVYLDSVWIASTTETYYYYHDLLGIGQTHIVGVDAQYSTGHSSVIQDSITYYTCDYFNPPGCFEGFVYQGSALLTWGCPTEVDRWDFLGYKIWRNGEVINKELITESPYYDHPWPCGTFYYNMTAVYIGGESCFIDPSVKLTFDNNFSPPWDLTACIGNDDSIILTWHSPPPPVWIHWDDGVNCTAIGLTSGGTFSVASRWDEEDLQPYSGQSLIKIAFFPSSNVTEYILKVWKGDNAANLVIEYPLSGLNMDAWNIIDLPNFVLIDASEELWFGYTCSGQPPGERPAGCDSGPAIIGKGDLVSTDGSNWAPLSSYGLNYNWNLQGGVVWLSNQVPLTQIPKKQIQNNSCNELKAVRLAPSPNAKFIYPRADSLLGYNLYKNGVEYQFISPADNSYMDILPPPGKTEYHLSAIYDAGESCEAGPAIITVAPARIEGIIFDLKTNDPVEGAIISIYPSGFSSVSAYDGSYSIINLPAGWHQIITQADGYKTDTISNVRINYGQTLILDIGMSDETVYIMPFSEAWDSASFVPQDWTFEPSLGNWCIHDDEGNNAPAAEFNGFPHYTNYSFCLTSPLINVTDPVHGFEMAFDLKKAINNPTDNEFLKVEIWNDTSWIELAEFSNDMNTGWSTFTYFISKKDVGSLIKFRFIATGSNSSDLDYWGIDNISIDFPEIARINGTVTELATGNPIQGVEVKADDYEPAYTDTNGHYSLILEKGFYEISFTRDAYNTHNESNVFVTDTTELDIEMTQPVLRLDPLSIYVETYPFWGTEIRYINISNDGNGLLGWQASIDFLNENDNKQSICEVWDIAFRYNITDASGGNSSQAGVEFDGTYFYTTLSNGASINKYNRDGTYIGTYPIVGASTIRDLAWDGQYLYGGSATPLIYIIDPVNMHVVNSIDAPENVRGIAYDNSQDAFWISDLSSDFYLVGRNGNTLAEISNPGLEAVYGLAYDDFSGVPYLWAFSQDFGGADLIQIDVFTGQMTGIAHDVLDDIPGWGAGMAGGAFITRDYLPGRIIIGGLVQGVDDWILGYELYAWGADDWAILGCNSGTLQPGQSQDVPVYFVDPGNLNWMYLYEANVNVTSDPNVGDETVELSIIIVEDIKEIINATVLKIYPNPAQDNITIESDVDINELKITNYTGQVIYESDLALPFHLQINTTKFNNGIYLITCRTTNSEYLIKKFVIMR